MFLLFLLLLWGLERNCIKTFTHCQLCNKAWKRVNKQNKKWSKKFLNWVEGIRMLPQFLWWQFYLFPESQKVCPYVIVIYLYNRLSFWRTDKFFYKVKGERSVKAIAFKAVVFCWKFVTIYQVRNKIPCLSVTERIRLRRSAWNKEKCK